MNLHGYPLVPKTSASASSATPACQTLESTGHIVTHFFKIDKFILFLFFNIYEVIKDLSMTFFLIALTAIFISFFTMLLSICTAARQGYLRLKR